MGGRDSRWLGLRIQESAEDTTVDGRGRIISWKFDGLKMDSAELGGARQS